MKIINKCIKMSLQIYKQPKKIILNNKTIIEDRNTGAFCILGTKDNTSFIVFRGTEAKCNDILIDAFFHKIKTKQGKFHAGFLLAYSSIHKQLFEKIKKLKLDNNKLIITGHSLGAAMATLCAFYIQCNCTVITFGSPRIGDAKFVKTYRKKNNIKTIRIVNGADVVTKIPYLWLGYRHVEKTIHIGKKNNLFPWGNWGKDHRPYIYYKVITNKMQKNILNN